ncbi:hypothetical protein vseg_006589 [Gypsophila vaccaria]
MGKTHSKFHNHKIKTKVVLQFTLPLILFIVITLQTSKNVTLFKSPTSININNISNVITSPIQNQTTFAQDISISKNNTRPKCDLFSGQWVPNPKGPYYTNTSCGVIQEHQNCMKFGRPDTKFMKWKWKPDGCDLPVFDPTRFLNIVKDKSLAFVGDSVARNQMQSLICLLSRVANPKDVSNSTDDNFKHYYYQDYNFTISIYWSPFLVKAQENDPNGKPGKSFMGLFLDEPNEAWTAHISKYNYVIVSAGHWFFRPLIYREKGEFIGCRYCELDGLREYSLSYGYRNAFRTAFQAIFENKDFRGDVYLRTFAPAHFEGGDWNHGGDCLRKSPYKKNEINLEGENLDMYTSQIKEFNEAQKLARKYGRKFELIDTTRMMLMRPDGHPSTYGRPANVDWPSDCVHWCLPGPIDSWNDFLLEMLSVKDVKPVDKTDRLANGEQ